MKKFIILFLITISFQGYGQITGKNVTSINLKINNLNTSLQKYKEKEWKMLQKGADGSNTEIRGFNVVSANDKSIAFELKEYGLSLIVNFIAKKADATENGKPSSQKIEFINANNLAVKLEQDDLVDIDANVDGLNVTSIKWKNELMNDMHTLNMINSNEWSCSYEAINMKSSFPKWTKKFKEIDADKNSITLEEINEDPSVTMFYATKFKIDIISKIIYKAVYEADVKKWTPLEKDDNGINIFLTIK